MHPSALRRGTMIRLSIRRMKAACPLPPRRQAIPWSASPNHPARIMRYCIRARQVGRPMTISRRYTGRPPIPSCCTEHFRTPLMPTCTRISRKWFPRSRGVRMTPSRMAIISRTCLTPDSRSASRTTGRKRCPGHPMSRRTASPRPRSRSACRSPASISIL